MPEDDPLPLLSLLLTPGLGPRRVGAMLDAFGTASAALGASAAELRGLDGFGRSTAEKVRRSLDQTLADRAGEEEMERVQRAKAELIPLGDARYPQPLALIPDPPPLLWVRGELREDDAVALAIVGSRKCSTYGREQAERFGGGLAEAGLTVVSGGAYGIDAAAHRGTLAVAGRTIVVLGSGLGEPYPPEHVPLFREVTERQLGAVVSELPMRTPPRPQNFLPRNRIISGLSLGVLLIEAATRSGALRTARDCVEQHGRELFAVPGRIDSPHSAGCHQVLQEGWAKLVTSPGDVLDGLGETGTTLQAGVERSRNAAAAKETVAVLSLTPPQQRLVSAFTEGAGELTLDQLVALADLPASTVQAELTMLEIRGVVTRTAGRFRLKR